MVFVTVRTSSLMAEALPIQANLIPDECDQMHMTGTLQRVIEESRIAIAAIPYELAWGEVDSAEDLMGYQEAIASGTSK